MNKSDALAFVEKNKINLDAHDSVIVTSDNAVYLNSELEPIAAHCKDHNKTYFVLKSNAKTPAKEELKTEDVIEVEEKQDEPKVDPAPKKKGKK